MSARAAKRKRTTSQGGGGKAGGGKTQRGPKGTSSESPAQGPAASKEGGTESGPVFPLTIPRPLMRLVYKEQELIEQEKQLPREPNVNKILDDYLKTLPPDEDTTEGESGAEQLWDEVVEGIRHYFNKSLGCLLLYGPERAQYNELRRKNKNVLVADVYGAEHLLRLFVKFPDLLEKAEMEEEARVLIRTKMERFLAHMNSNKKSLFTAEYQAAGRRSER
ncbi:chromatin modificationrelated protein eaf3, putative [Acanthamoeba castellanii str. Neff]|uniref:Chromatin modificationrelated protein eaf3, putative n=1 Tax=Acanthamoeba castellanii (strain ATCC 30010 / Neff) TaxID=1257118 RepID=L8GU26_ACACF|nr:chromatin modificationrelated protein eaf3, putative [Acanthamoeba castellanii str. Neff]ELR16679.1 chromatin modificationrelated protein eaf3, putative [Acanthamoeba castellanii str. Neff]